MTSYIHKITPIHSCLRSLLLCCSLTSFKSFKWYHKGERCSLPMYNTISCQFLSPHTWCIFLIYFVCLLKVEKVVCQLAGTEETTPNPPSNWHTTSNWQTMFSSLPDLKYLLVLCSKAHANLLYFWTSQIHVLTHLCIWCQYKLVLVIFF